MGERRRRLQAGEDVRSTAASAPAENYEDLMQAGHALHTQGKFREAVDAFARANRAAPSRPGRDVDYRAPAPVRHTTRSRKTVQTRSVDELYRAYPPAPSSRDNSTGPPGPGVRNCARGAGHSGCLRTSRRAGGRQEGFPGKRLCQRETTSYSELLPQGPEPVLYRFGVK